MSGFDVQARTAWLTCSKCGEWMAALPSRRRKLPVVACCNADCRDFHKVQDLTPGGAASLDASPSGAHRRAQAGR